MSPIKSIVLEYTYLVYWFLLMFGPRGLWTNMFDGKITPMSQEET